MIGINELQKTVKAFLERMTLLEMNEGKKMIDLKDKVKSTDETIELFANRWIGGWARKDINHYDNISTKYNQTYQLTPEFIYNFVEEHTGVDFDTLAKQINVVSNIYQEFNDEFVANFSIIKDNDDFKQETELLAEKIEKFKWGVYGKDFINFYMPKNIAVYDHDVLSRGLTAPPHITVRCYYLELVSKCQVVEDYYKLVKKFLTQIEIKLKHKLGSESTYSNTDVLVTIFNKFHQFHNQLQHRHNKRSTILITDEYDVQDLLHAILILHFDDIREEEYTPSYAGSSTRVDFLLKKERAIIEVKKTRQNLKDKEIGEQLILDIAHYRNHPDCNELYCFVYDPENRVKNPRGLESDLSKSYDDFKVKVFIKP